MWTASLGFSRALAMPLALTLAACCAPSASHGCRDTWHTPFAALTQQVPSLCTHVPLSTPTQDSREEFNFKPWVRIPTAYWPQAGTEEYVDATQLKAHTRRIPARRNTIVHPPVEARYKKQSHAWHPDWPLCCLVKKALPAMATAQCPPTCLPQAVSNASSEPGPGMRMLLPMVVEQP